MVAIETLTFEGYNCIYNVASNLISHLSLPAHWHRYCLLPMCQRTRNRRWRRVWLRGGSVAATLTLQSHSVPLLDWHKKQRQCPCNSIVQMRDIGYDVIQRNIKLCMLYKTTHHVFGKVNLCQLFCNDRRILTDQGKERLAMFTIILHSVVDLPLLLSGRKWLTVQYYIGMCCIIMQIN